MLIPEQLTARLTDRRHLLVTCAAIVVFVVFFTTGLLIHENFGTAAFDLGIFDQAFWRYSRLLDTFNTVRGIYILGDHFSPIALIFAPLYALYPHVVWPLAVQAISVAVGGIILFCIAESRLPHWPWLSVGFALSYYLHPVVHSTLLRLRLRSLTLSLKNSMSRRIRESG